MLKITQINFLYKQGAFTLLKPGRERAVSAGQDVKWENMYGAVTASQSSGARVITDISFLKFGDLQIASLNRAGLSERCLSKIW